MSNPPSTFSFRVEADQAAVRLDTLVATEIDHCSRSFAATLIRQGHIRVNGSAKKPGYLMKAGELVSGVLPALEPPSFQPEEIPLEIIYEDAELLVVNKAPSMVVHPAPGHNQGTLANALLHHCPDLAGISGCLRPGIVHRLDKGTSGALVVAKTSRTMLRLSDQFKSRRIQKRYLGLVFGVPKAQSGTIDQPIGRHPQDRKKMSIHTRTPRAALTHWHVREAFVGSVLLELEICTGRTHQIRVHCKSIGHPIIGDPVYCNRGDKQRLRAVSDKLYQAVRKLDRQMLHAWKLSFVHPLTGKRLRVTAPLPEDMAHLLERFRSVSAQST